MSHPNPQSTYGENEIGTSLPNPGSDKAINQGCICAVLDNGHGNEELGKIRGFWITEGCQLHDIQASQAK